MAIAQFKNENDAKAKAESELRRFLEKKQKIREEENDRLESVLENEGLKRSLLAYVTSRNS